MGELGQVYIVELQDDLCQEPSNEGGTVIQKENNYNFKKKEG